MRTSLAIVIAVLIACSNPSTSSATFNNGGFETGALAPWQVSTFSNQNGISVFPPQTLTDLGLIAGGFGYSRALSASPPRSKLPSGMSEPGPLEANVPRWPYFDTGSAVINEYGLTDPHGLEFPQGANQNVNSLKQSLITSAADVDPRDGLVHVNFVLAPVLQAGGHPAHEGAYVFIILRNKTFPRVGDLYTYFVYANQPGVPWQTQVYDAVPSLSMEDWLYTDWQVFDIELRKDQLFVGDELELEVLAAGCESAGHAASLYVDGFSTFFPSLTVNLSAPTVANVDSDLTYEFFVRNGGVATETNVVFDQILPPNTTFISVVAVGASCTQPQVGMAGTVECNFGTLTPGESRFFHLMVHNNPTTFADAATSGTATSGTANTLSNTGAAWTIDEWQGYTVYLTGGPGAGQERVIASNTTNSLTVAAPWSPTPFSSTTYAILNPPADTGTATSGTTTTLTQTGAGFVDNEFSRAILTLLSGGQQRTVESNTATTLTVTAPFPAPASGTRYAVTRPLKVLNGDYGVRSQDQPRLLGPLVETALMPAPLYADLQVQISNPTLTVSWAGNTQYTLTVRNNGPAPVVNALVENTFSAELGAVAWTCTPLASCGTASGTGNINALVSLPRDEMAEFTIDAMVVAGSGVGIATSLAVVTGGGVVESHPLDNADTDHNDIVEAPQTATSTPTATPTFTPTSTPTNTPTATPTNTPTKTPDTSLPTIACPQNIAVPGTSPVAVLYVASCTDAAGIMFLGCQPPSGSQFLPGSTPVICTCTDLAGNTSTCSFTITVGTAPTATPSNTPTNTPTVTPTGTPTVTPTNTRIPQGGDCTTPSECSTGFCEDGVCCNTACTDPLMPCNLPGQVGTCASATTPAPTMSPRGLLLALAVLGGLGAMAMRRRARPR